MAEVYILWGADEAELKDVAAKLWAADEAPELELLVGDAREKLEGLPVKFHEKGLELARIIAVVNAVDVEKRKELKTWMEMLAHFADVMLLTHTKETSPAWLGTFKKSFKDRPMKIVQWPEELKKNAGATITEVTYPEARRLSQYFDVDPEAQVPVFESEDENPEEAEEAEDDEEEIPEEKYFERDAAGRYWVKVAKP